MKEIKSSQFNSESNTESSSSSSSGALSSEALINEYLISEINKNNSVARKDGSHELGDLFHKGLFYFRKYWLLVLILVALFASYGWFINIQKPLLFRATTSMIQDSSTNVTQSQASLSQYYFQLQNFFQTQSKIMKSDQMAERVTESLQSNNQEYKYSTQTYIDYLLKRSEGRFYYPLLKMIAPLVNKSSVERDIAITPNLIANGLVIQVDEKIKSMELSFISSSPFLARDAANQFADDFIAYKYEKSAREIDNGLIWLANKLEASRQALDLSQKKLLAYQKENNLLGSDEIKSITNSSIQASYSRYLSSRNEYQEVLSKYGDKHPLVREAQLQLNKAKNAYDSLASSGFSNKTKEVELANLERDVTNDRQIYETYLTRFSEANFETKQSESVTIVPDILDYADLPNYPFAPNPSRAVLEWVLYGLLFAFLIAVIRELFNQTFRTEEELRQFTDNPILGDIPFVHDSSLKGNSSEKSNPLSGVASREFYALHYPLSVFSEKINHIRTSLLFNSKQRAQVIMISSASQGEGKTILSTNLSYSFSRLGKTILLDCDLRRPRVSKILGAVNHPGIVEYMAGLNSLDECIRPVFGMDGFDSLSSDITPPEPLEMLSTRRFEELIETLRAHYEYIIIDMPPIVPVSDAVVVGKLVDSVVLIVKSMKTKKKLLKAALERFNNTGVNLAGLVIGSLNKNNMNYYVDDYTYGYTEDNKK